MGVLRRYPTDIVNTALDELMMYEFIQKGCKLVSIKHIQQFFSLII